MATRYGIIGRLAEAARRAGALFAAIALVSATARPAWAQNGRRQAEPEANPQFQQALQNAGEGGGPVGGSTFSSEEPASPAGVQSIQIGAAPAAPRAASRESTAPLDSRVTLRMKGAPLATFLDAISAQARINFIITEGLESRRVTAFLQNVTVREALQVLLEIKGLTYQQIGKSNTYVVTPRSRTVENFITRIYTLSYIPLIDVGGGQNGGAGASANNGGAGGQGGGGGGGQGGGAEGGGQGGQTGGAAGGGNRGGGVAILNVLESILSKAGKVAIEPRTNALIVTDIPEVFPQIEQIIAELDRKAPQIIIEAQIVEINSNRSKELGFQWSGQFGTFTAGARDTSFPLVLPNDLKKTRFLDPISGGIAGASGLSAPSSLNMSALSVTLAALVKRGEARFLGKPKILTLNNKQATIKIERNQATAILPTLTAAGSGASQSSNQVQREKTGLTLIVTPQVNKDGYITMLLQPKFTNVVPAAVGQNTFDTVERSAETLVRVKNGQTLVMGGLLQSQESKQVSKVPFLGYIPLIGWLFTHVISSRDNTDLVIFITPTLVSD